MLPKAGKKLGYASSSDEMTKEVTIDSSSKKIGTALLIHDQSPGRNMSRHASLTK
jgi:hypothetical protein